MDRPLHSSRTDPMRIYVLWHSSCLQGEEFARDIYKWFRGDPSDISQCGYGIPVEYRSYPFQAASEPFREIELDKAEINVVVPLVDEHMVVNSHWRKYLSSLASDTTCLICPVALHPAAYQLPEEITRLNFLRIDKVNDPKSWNQEQLLTVRRQRLLSLLTQACCRLLWREQNKPGAIDLNLPASPIKVFISHAKADGTDIAEAIREQIYQHGQLQAFFDESDLAIGHVWEKELENSAHLGTTAMIAVFTDTYASRPWCRREIRLARQVKPSQSSTEIGEQHSFWHVKPLLVVDALNNGASYFLPEFGYAPVVRWNSAQVPLLIDQLLREILLYGYNEKRSQLLSSRTGQYHLNCIPDLQTILSLRKAIKGTINRLVIPPPGLPSTEEEVLREFLSSDTTFHITTFDQVTDFDDQAIVLAEKPYPLSNQLIAVSISESFDLIQYGHGLEHLHELIVSIARVVLRLGGNLAYGGDLRAKGFTKTLFLLARGEHMNKRGWEQRLYNFLAWPYYQQLTASEEAQLINTCRFVRVNPKDAGLEEIFNDNTSLKTPESAYQAIRCLSCMRELMTRGGAKCFDGQSTPPLAARILVGGKTQDFMGIIPGLFEEYLLAAEDNLPTYIIGGFGGAAHILSEALRTQDEQKGKLFYENYKGKETSLLTEKYKRYSAELYKPYPDGPHPGKLYERLNTCLKRTRENKLKPLHNGLTTEENEKLMTSTNSKTILSLLCKGLITVFRD